MLTLKLLVCPLVKPSPKLSITSERWDGSKNDNFYNHAYNMGILNWSPAILTVYEISCTLKSKSETLRQQEFKIGYLPFLLSSFEMRETGYSIVDEFTAYFKRGKPGISKKKCRRD